MKICLSWLRDYFPTALSPEQAGDALTHGGLPVEVFEKHGEDDVMDVEVTSNRGDCLSHVGVARELAGLVDKEFQSVLPKVKESRTAASSAVNVTIDAIDLCPHYTVRIIRNVKIGASPSWMVNRLEAVGLRSINNIVDITNYVMFELGQPLHAFDLDKIAGQSIVVRRALPGEKLTSLDGKNHTLQPDMLVIADTQKAVALAGIMGGQDTEVTVGTTNILLESARFEPLCIRKTARTLAMKSDSSYRFERGIDPTLPELASLRAAQLILEIAGGELLEGYVQAGNSGYVPKHLTLRLTKLKRVLGIDLDPAEVVAALQRVRCTPTLIGDQIDVIVPHWRLDINLEIDLVEEVARIIGYSRIPMRDEISVRLQPVDAAGKTVNALRDILVASGFFQAVTFSFVSDSLAGEFRPAAAKSLVKADAAVRKADGQLRPSIIPGLLEAVARNENNGNAGAQLFEIGSTFWTDASGQIEEVRKLGIVATHDLHRARGVIELLLSRLDAKREVKFLPAKRDGFTVGAYAEILWGDKIIGYFGTISKAVADKAALRDTPVVAELELQPLLDGRQLVPQLNPLPRFPGVWRDLSLVVADAVRYEALDHLIQTLRIDSLEKVEYITTYRGKPLSAGNKSLSIKLHFRSPARTLTGEEVEANVTKIIEAAKGQLAATLRA